MPVLIEGRSQKDGKCVFDYTVEIEGGYTTYRCRVPVTDPPVWVKGNKTSFDLSKCEIVGSGNLLSD